MMNDDVLLSIIIPSGRDSSYLKRCLESIKNENKNYDIGALGGRVLARTRATYRGSSSLRFPRI